MRNAMIGVVLSTLVTSSSFANVPVVPVPQLDTNDKLTLARALVGEADWNEPDHRAIAWVLARRYKFVSDTETFAEYVARYSSSLKVKTPRALFVQSLPWGPLDVPGYEAYVRHWQRVRGWVELWARGKIPDPCPSADHWGGTMDRAPVKWQPVNCGFTRNIFYKVPSKSQ